ncbi:MAG: 2-C-methyl-D-erythritol 4-phosphate cytidylyltransferase [Pseudonocardiales bacterium]|nr:MAG: 2-C-methyl-D-erythritol 4-phosphate cytidylyltransferase [Pseudonocardiales bacterium]
MAATGQLTVAAILVAAGDGRRLGASAPKAFCVVAGRTLLEHAASRFAVHPGVRDLVIVAPPSLVESAAALAPTADVVPGGPTRQESVARGIAVLADDVDTVLVHDVARPFVPADVITRVLAALRGGADAVVPALAITDTVKRVDLSGEVAETIDRISLRAVQTPQGFRRSVLADAHAAGAGGMAVSDDASLAEARGVRVVVVEGADESFKITRPWDLALAELVAAR